MFCCAYVLNFAARKGGVVPSHSAPWNGSMTQFHDLRVTLLYFVSHGRKLY